MEAKMSIARWFQSSKEAALRRERKLRFAAIQKTNPAFKNLLEEWDEAEQTFSFLSSPWHFGHPLFARTLAMGESIVPLLLVELARNPRWWMFSALREISHENPVPSRHRGMFPEMSDDWLERGEEKGYLPAD